MQSKLSLGDLIPTIAEVVQSGKEASFTPKGVSMRPMLIGGRDEIVLVQPQFPLKKYALPLYVRKGGMVVLHRVVGIQIRENKTEYLMRGDNCWETERGITEENIVAVVNRFCRNGKWHSVNSVGYRLYVRLWCLTYPFRWIIHRCFSFAVRVLSKAKRSLLSKKDS